MNKDLTVGKPSQVLWQFCLPMFGSIIFQQLYNIADSLVAGKFIGENALAAVGNSYEITLIFIAFAFGCNIGCSVIVSRYFGAKDYDEMKTFGLHFPDRLCRAVRRADADRPGGLPQPAGAHQHPGGDPCGFCAVSGYLRSGPALHVLLQHCHRHLLRSGRQQNALLLPGSLVSVQHRRGHPVRGRFQDGRCRCGMGYLPVPGCELRAGHGGGVPPHPRLPHHKVVLFSWNMLGKVAVVAIPSILQQSFVSVGNIILQSVINTFGASVIAGYSAAVKLNNMVITSFTTLGNGISNYTSQNMGAGKMDRVKAGFGAGRNLVWLICVPIVILYFFFGRFLLLLFMNDPQGPAIDTGMLFLRILSPFYFVVSLKLVTDGILRGCGLMGRFMIATFSDLILRVGMAIVLSATALGSTGIWLSWPIGWCIGTVLSLVFYVTAIRKALAEPVAQAEAQGLEAEPVAQAEFAAQAEMETL